MLSDTSNCYPYQVRDAEGMLNALDRHGAVINAGDTGTGKTYSIMAVARHRGVAPVVVCPKAVMPAWHRVAELFGGSVHTINYEKLIGSENEFGTMYNPPGLKEARAAVRVLDEQAENCREVMPYVIGEACMEGDSEHLVNYYKHIYPGGWYHAKIMELTRAKAILKDLNKQRKFTWDQNVPLIVYDEGHRIKNQTSLGSKTAVAARQQRIQVIVASATLAKDPIDMYAVGMLLGLHNGSKFWDWCFSHGCELGEHGGLVFRGGQPSLKRLHATIFPTRGVRVTREEIPDFPETQITADLYDLPGAGEIEALYGDVKTQLDDLRDRRAQDRNLEHPLGILLRARQEIEYLKVPLFVEMAQDAIEEGLSVAIFVNFDETLREICKRLKTDCMISGGQTGGQGAEDRQASIDNFNLGEERAIVCNIKAGGVGVSLHDTTGDFPRLSLISPTYSAIDLIQALGRIWRSGAKGAKSLQRIVLIKGTVEEGIQKNLQGKLKNLSLINDGDVVNIFS